jgi:RNA polymerase-binding transcription factor DksA
MDTALIDGELDVEADIDEEEEEEVVVEEPKKKGRRSRSHGKDDKRKFDSEDFVRKQVVKIDLNKSLLKKSIVDQPKPFVNTSDNRSRYTDTELAEFKELIIKKLDEAQSDYDLLKQTLSHADDHGTDDTSPTFKLLEDGSDVLSKEETAQLASRQEKYIVSLKNALVRIENKSYGICRATGKLIPKERLRSVPHATLSIDAKLNQNN